MNLNILSVDWGVWIGLSRNILDDGWSETDTKILATINNGFFCVKNVKFGQVQFVFLLFKFSFVWRRRI